MTDIPVPEVKPTVSSLPHRPTRMWYAALILSLLLPLLVAIGVSKEQALPSGIAPLFIHDALLGQAEAVWKPVTLPEDCPIAAPSARSSEQCDAVFRLGYRHDPADGHLPVLYISSFQGRLDISLNGVRLASGPWQQAGAYVSVAVPMLIPLPAPLLRPGDNEVEIVLTKRGFISGFLDRVAIGPDARLRPDYDRRVFLVTMLPRMIDGWQIAMGLAMFVMWLARPREQAFLLFSGMLLFNVLPSLPSWPSMAGDVLDESLLRLASQGGIASGSLGLPLAWLFVGRRPPVPVGVFLLLPTMVAISHFTLPLHTHGWLVVTVVLPLMAVLLTRAAVVVFRKAMTSRDIAATLLFGAILIGMVLMLHDMLVLHDVLRGDRVQFGRFWAPILMATVSALMIWRFAQTMTALDQFSARLMNEVAAAEEALRRSFAREQAQARAAILEAERVRLMSDLHDGIAGQLVSILSVCELRGNDSAGVADAVRAALADLRLIVASLEDYGEDLGVLLALFRERIEPQAAAHGMTVKWRIDPLPEVKGLHPGAALSIFRLLQEAAINAARHSGSATLVIEAGPSPLSGHGVRLCLRDQGRGGVAPRAGSYGLGNMRRRAEALNAGLTIDSGSSGTTVTIDLPAQLP
ncbi:MAG TPA: hypothetical protein VEB64_16815 [Azospirillaceae bacterium]|nr:hypothetical protein [Azospirillaceae bacterium]